MSDKRLAPEEFSVGAAVGLILSVAVAVVGLFLLPTLREFGVGFWTAFWSLLALEFVAFLGVAFFVFRLYRERSFE